MENFLPHATTIKPKAFFSDSYYGNMVTLLKMNLKHCCCSVTTLCSTLSNPMDCSIPSFPSFTISQSLLKFMSIESMMPSNYLILCHSPLLPSVFPSIRVFSNELAFCIRWPKYWNFSFNISPSNEYSGLISLGLTGFISLQSKGLSRVFSNTTVQKHQFFGTQLSL